MKWPTLAADMGAPAGENTVTISRFTGGNVIVSVFGDSAEKLPALPRRRAGDPSPAGR